MKGAVVSIVPREERDYVDRLIKDCARGLVSRNAMLYGVAAILRRHGIRRLPLGSYEVVYMGQVEGLPVIHIHGRNQISEACPACGSRSYRYMLTERELPFCDYDIATMFCWDCGCFYRAYFWKVDRAGGGGGVA